MTIVYDLLEVGASRDDLVSMVNLTANEHGAQQTQLPGVLLSDEVVFDELPPGLIDLPSAARKYNLNRGTVRNWITGGKLRTYGRLKGAAQGGGLLLLNEAELLDYMSTPKHPGGRPPNS